MMLLVAIILVLLVLNIQRVLRSQVVKMLSWHLISLIILESTTSDLGFDLFYFLGNSMQLMGDIRLMLEMVKLSRVLSLLRLFDT